MSNQKIVTLEALRSKYKPVTLAKPPSWPFPFSTVQQINKRHVDSSMGKTSYLVKFKEGSTAEVASDVLRKTNAALVNKYEKGKLSQLEDSSDDEDQKDTLAPIKKRIVLNGSGSESEADDELDDDVGEAEYQDQVTISDSDSSGTEDGFIVDSDEENERRSTRQNRKKPRLYYGAPSLQEYQDINDQDERMIVKKKRDKYMMGFSYSVPLYTDDEFIEKHADDCYVCSKDGYPNGANNDLREVAAGPMAKKRRLLLCKTCTLSCHNSCLAQSADKSFDKHGNFVCSKCRLPTIAKCGICSSLKKEESILFRCSLCFRGLHKSCRTPADDDCYSQYNQCYECHKYVYNNIAAEKVLAQKTVNDKAMVLIKWKNLSYRHVAWVYTSWFEHASKTMYRAYLVKAANGDIPSGSPGPALEEWKQIDRILSIEWADKRQENAKRVFAVYKDTAYDEAVWDEPPTEKEPALFKAYNVALKRYRRANKVAAPEKMRSLVKSVREMANKEDYSKHEYKAQPSFIKGGQLMPHQLEALNFLLYKWESEQSCILADDMGLGKTIQIISFLSVLFNKYDIYPFLLCVPNSTATNWVREFEKWAPEMVVAPFWGGQKSQRLSAKYELFKGGEKKSLKCHVIITTYQSVMDTSALMLQFFPVLIIDESQRLKNDESLLFKKLNQYKVDHKILLTGTPLQNNLRELFNIMHFIQPKLFKGIQADEYEDMSPELIEELHNRLRPFFLRRTKEEVLKQLPPKFEIIVPLSMSPVQKEAYKSALGNNIHELLSDMQVSKVKRQKGLSSVLMNLRKILNHPFLIDGVEVTQPDEESTIREMISACEKLRVFHIMLPKLRAKGHRMLIFSTMTRSLDVLEDYLTYQDVRYCRLDGSCSERDRVRSMDSFNAPNSEIDVFLLSTRAGGVGINLATADTIIFWDSDYNPYADAQAIGRAHRIGQTRMVLTFRFMTRLSVEEKILQIGKKKMALEHVVVERMAQEENKIEDIQSILKYGAKNLFDNDDSADIHYDEKKIDALIEREQYRATAEEQKQKEIDDVEKNGEEGMNFSFAKVWKSNGDTEEIQVDGKEEENDDFWTKFLAQKQQEAQKKKEQKEQESLNMGRGLRKRKKPGNYYEKGQKNTNSGSSVDGDFKLDDNNQDSMSDDSENDRDSFVDEIELGMRKLYSNKIMNGTAANQTPNQVSIGAPKHKAKPLFTPLTHLAMVPQHSYISSQEAVRQFDSLPQAKRDEFAKLFEQSFTNSSLRSQLYQYSADMKFKNRADLVQTEVQRIGNDQDSSYQPLTFHAQTLKELNERHDTIIKNMTVADKDEWEVQRKHDQGLLSKFEERWRSAHSTKAPANTLPQAPRAPQLPQLPQKPPPLPQVLLTGAPGGSSNRNKQATFQNENLKQQLAPHLQQQLLRFQKQVAPATPSVSQQPHTAQQQILQYMKPQPSQQQQQQQQPILLQRQPMVGQNNNHASVMFNHLQSNIHNQLNHQLQLNGTNQQVNVDADLIRTLHSQLNNQMQELKLYPGATPSYPPPGQYENVDLLYHHIKRNEITLHQFRQLNHLNGNPQLQYNNIRPYFPQYQSGPQPQQNNGPQNGHHPTN